VLHRTYEAEIIEIRSGAWRAYLTIGAKYSEVLPLKNYRRYRFNLLSSQMTVFVIIHLAKTALVVSRDISRIWFISYGSEQLD